MWGNCWQPFCIHPKVIFYAIKKQDLGDVGIRDADSWFLRNIGLHEESNGNNSTRNGFYDP